MAEMTGLGFAIALILLALVVMLALMAVKLIITFKEKV